MTANTGITGLQALDYLQENPQTRVRVGVTDIDGVLRGKYLSPDKFRSSLNGGLSICDCVLGWDVNDILYDDTGQSSVSGWHRGYPDAPLRIVAETAAIHINDQGMATLSALCEFEGEARKICPRSRLAAVVARAERAGYQVKCGFEYEFTLFRETSESLHDKHFREPHTLTRGNFGYSGLKASLHTALFQGLITWCEQHGIPLEALHTENGPGMWEAALAPADAMTSADRAVMFKLLTKQYAAEHDLSACFMAKWSMQHQGQGGHIHLSLLDQAGQPAFASNGQVTTDNQLLRAFIAGQLALMPEWMVLLAPNINSYKRLLPGTWAPTNATWGIDNRTCALRVVGNSPPSIRVEYRVPGADANPYLALAAAIASGIHGIENHLSPEEQIFGNAYEQDLPGKLKLPLNLELSSQHFRQSKAAEKYFGSEFVKHFSRSRDWECAQFAKQITEWEFARYAEII